MRLCYKSDKILSNSLKKKALKAMSADKLQRLTDNKETPFLLGTLCLAFASMGLTCLVRKALLSYALPKGLHIHSFPQSIE